MKIANRVTCQNECLLMLTMFISSLNTFHGPPNMFQLLKYNKALLASGISLIKSELPLSEDIQVVVIV